MYKNKKHSLLSPDENKKISHKFHNMICRTHEKTMSYSEAYRRKISWENGKSSMSGVLNRSI